VPVPATIAAGEQTTDRQVGQPKPDAPGSGLRMITLAPTRCAQVASYLGLVPLEDSSGHRRRLGHITKQGSSILRFLLVEAAQVTVRSLPESRSKYLAMRRGRKIAMVARARRLAIRLYWMWRQGWDYEQWTKFGSQAGQPGNRDGVPSNTEELIGNPAPFHGGV